MESNSSANRHIRTCAFVFPHVLPQVTDPTRVYVHVALGFHVEFTLSEAITFAGVKRTKLKQEVQKLKEREAVVARDVGSAQILVQQLRAIADEG